MDNSFCEKEEIAYDGRNYHLLCMAYGCEPVWYGVELWDVSTVDLLYGADFMEKVDATNERDRIRENLSDFL